MTKRDKSRLLPGRIVLPEVYDRLDSTGKPVKVIFDVHRGARLDEAVEFLRRFGVEIVKDPSGHTDYYIFATIADRKQAEKIDGTYGSRGARHVGHAWLDKEISGTVATSEKTVNAPPARHLFACDGEGIHWAVLDSGVDIRHKWLAANFKGEHFGNAQMSFVPGGKKFAGDHGTHVAGIIVKIAPKVALYDYKVLGEDGGSSSTVIRAMHRIRELNFKAGEAVIHGVNMSLGGPVPVGSYGCGWSPECQEANRLVESGVVVCVAAGNDGYKHFACIPGGQLEVFSTYVDLTITDPGNAEEVITVGSAHKVYPHTYGPSYFSSRGPTGDGRFKPDCLAPGEKIVSAKAGTRRRTIKLDGTSMATPHVSAIIALFLSAKPEFKGRAREVKQILLASCTDLKRDRYFQGAGLVDALRMIQSV